MVRQIPKNSGRWYYQFIIDGIRHSGPCIGCTNKRDAELFENKVRKGVEKANEEKSEEIIKEKIEKKIIKTLTKKIIGEINDSPSVKLEDAFSLSLKKPRKRQVSETFVSVKREAFNDFVSFMKDKYPDIDEMKKVEKRHAEEYIALLRSSGRYVKELSYIRNGVTVTRRVSGIPSSRTATLYQTVCKEVFRLLASDAGLITNPFEEIVKPAGDEETREAFDDEEINLIRDNLDDFTRPLFAVAMATALREGDICTLRWEDIDFRNCVIRRIMNKTKNIVEIPMIEGLINYIYSQKENNDSEYVFPKHAKMYLENRSGIAYRIKKFLEGLGIKTTRIPKGRTRAISIKDLHSCRHTFCYLAGKNGVPLPIVKSIVGHMTPEMTERYMNHATLADKQQYMLKIADFIGTGTTAKILSAGELEPERKRLKHFAETLPIEEIKTILANIEEM